MVVTKDTTIAVASVNVTLITIGYFFGPQYFQMLRIFHIFYIFSFIYFTKGWLTTLIIFCLFVLLLFVYSCLCREFCPFVVILWLCGFTSLSNFLLSFLHNFVVVLSLFLSFFNHFMFSQSFLLFSIILWLFFLFSDYCASLFFNHFPVDCLG